MTKKFKEFKTGAQKDTKGKNRLDLVTPEMIEALGEVLTYGAIKYEDHNWLKGIPFMTSVAAAQRHLIQFLKGNDIDEESGLNHIDQAFLNLGMIVTQIRKGRADLDDRYNRAASVSFISSKVKGTPVEYLYDKPLQIQGCFPGKSDTQKLEDLKEDLAVEDLYERYKTDLKYTHDITDYLHSLDSRGNK